MELQLEGVYRRAVKARVKWTIISTRTNTKICTVNVRTMHETEKKNIKPQF
ncbi:hypothetical protein DPMN_055903 [Dreissena polymorpha]|uniref:Uncharacterized protein n=1 Tax=Dreissena polymorpha TaxID=45954 RepID=A0A9D4HT47_DREPO|nr:hypothetical protein DPMN_055903 [Dreissena polymorpha]